MCHPPDARPPAPPAVAGTIRMAADHAPLRITAADGNQFNAYRATPTTPNGSAVVLLPDRRGLHPFYDALAQRFAEVGFTAVAMDYYGRTAGTAARDESFDFSTHTANLQPAHIDADVAATVGFLREQGHDGPVFTVGFCLGGTHSWRQAATDLGLAGAIGFYGPPQIFGDAVESLNAPLLMLLAGDDHAASPEQFDDLTASFDRAGKTYEKHVYSGAPHSFFDVRSAEWEAACTDAWHRILDFTDRNARATSAG